MSFSPKQFLKSRRPEQFSDSLAVTEFPINRAFLEDYLNTLSNRSQEVEFERFARRLCELEVCPNLLPHTGPTGGGDSKVDSETYPVADLTALNWHVGVGSEAAKERWGFAFSVKQDWQPKLKDDIKKIHDTNRGYKKAFFVSNQYIPDKKRAELEDSLRQKYGMDIRIFDRTWLLDITFRKNHENIVREELRTGFPEEKKIKKGFMDLKKEDDLQVLDKKIQDEISRSQITLSTVDDAIESAVLSRELELGRIVIDGRFERAFRLANEYGNDVQQFEALYQKAWTTFWWHEDFASFVPLYGQLEEKVIQSQRIYDVERLTNHWYGLNAVFKQSPNLITKEVFQLRTKTLKGKLTKISKEENRPSAALHAKSLLLLIELTEKLYSHGDIGSTLKSLKNLVLRAHKFVGFPFKTLVQIITEMDEALEDSPEYKDLFTTILKIVEERDGELSSSKLLLNRSEKLLLLNRYYEVIKELSPALTKLYKHESKKEAVRALYFMGVAYDEVGLFWASRGAFLSAASLATNDFWVYGEINTMQVACYRRLKCVELKLGRIAQALDWHKLDFMIRNALVKKGYDAERIFEKVNIFDLILGALFLKSNLINLKSFEVLPDVLDDLGLLFSPVALMYALDDQAEFPKEFVAAVPLNDSKEFFEKWIESVPSDEMPNTAAYSEEAKVEYISNILGCKVLMVSANEEPCIELAESILAAIESFLSTGTLKHAFAREPFFELYIESVPDLAALAEFAVDDSQEKPVISIKCKKFNPHRMSSKEQESLKDIIFEIVVHSCARIAMFKDSMKDIEEIVRDERVADRALNFASSFITLGNVLGHKPKIKISEWSDTTKKRYELKRIEPVQLPPLKEQNSKERLKNHETPLLSEARHTDLEMLSVIRESLWNKAEWTGVGYACPPDSSHPPIFAILFKNIEAGKRIFSIWKQKFGYEDKNEEIRISVAQEIDQGNPHHYKVGIGSNLDLLKKEDSKGKFFSTMSRIHTMTPQNSQNIDNFKRAYERSGCYLLAPCAMGADGFPDIIVKEGLLKRKIYFRKASEIGPNDVDSMLRKRE